MGLDWNKLKELLSPEFDWDTAVQDALQTGDSLEDVLVYSAFLFRKFFNQIIGILFFSLPHAII